MVLKNMCGYRTVDSTTDKAAGVSSKENDHEQEDGV